MNSLTTFPTDLGWIAIAWQGEQILRLTFGHSDPQAALERFDAKLTDADEPDSFLRSIEKRLCRFARGNRKDDFQDIQLDLTGLTEFQKAITNECRRIPSGETLSYGKLAAQAGYPGAARAVGQVMSNNRFPLIVPCHRVVSASSLGGFSSPDGLDMKRRLLACESRPKQRARSSG